MRIECPACNATYQVPDEQLREGRLVRCVRCGTDWAPVVPLLPPEPEPDAAVETVAEPVRTVEPAAEPVAEPRAMALDDVAEATRPAVVPTVQTQHEPGPRRRAPWLVLAWIASIAIVAGGLTALYLERARVMKAWPPSTRAYAAIGLVDGKAPSERVQ